MVANFYTPKYQKKTKKKHTKTGPKSGLKRPTYKVSFTKKAYKTSI